MTSLTIKRINKTRFQVKDGQEVVRECCSFREAMNALISEDLMLLDNLDEFCNTEMDDLELVNSYSEAA